MQLIPAIDIRDGACVRLLRGDFEQVTHYSANPVDLAEHYRELGAAWLHIVDLDGAKSGSPQNLDLIRQMSAGGRMRIQLGGGIRDEQSLEAALAVADRVVLGSLAVDSQSLVLNWLETFGADRFTLGFDVRFDADEVPRVTTHGWTRDTNLSLADAIDTYAEAGLQHVLCTDVDKDGAMTGPNFELYSRSARQWPAIEIQASGGVRNVSDLEQLDVCGAAAAISGKALLDGEFTTEEIKRFLPNA